jgi:tricorn protease
MKSSAILLTVVLLSLATAAAAGPTEPVYLASEPALSPDGETLLFAWRGDIWSVPTAGGRLSQLTRHPARDSRPCFSPDGGEIAFVTDRYGSSQIAVMPAAGGTPEQITFHTAGYSLIEWCADGRLLATGSRDHFSRGSRRLFTVARKGRGPERLLFDATVKEGRLSPDGKRILFTREGVQYWRKGYKGSSASRIWIASPEKGSYVEVASHEGGCRSPLWKPGGDSFYYVGAQSGSFNLREREIEGDGDRQLTFFTDDSVLFPCISRNGGTIVFRHLFDFYRFRPGEGGQPERITILCDADGTGEKRSHHVLRDVSQAAFTDDGLEIAVVAGGDLWVMDTELREPRRLTDTPGEESSPVFSPGRDAILFISDRAGLIDIYRAGRSDTEQHWWRNDSFEIEAVTTEGSKKSRLTFSPDGKLIAWIQGHGDLWIAKNDGKDAHCLVESWSRISYDWSPDGKWIVYVMSDNDFNNDVWVRPIDGSAGPYNISRHPDNEYGPVWSPDGKTIAFTGRRSEQEIDIYYVHLTKEENEKSSRDRSLEKALEKIKKARKAKKIGKEKEGGNTEKSRETEEEKKEDEGKEKEGEKEGKKEKEKEKKKLPDVKIDFDGIHDRLRRIAIPDSRESGLFWSHDSKKLAFSASIKGKRGTYTVEFPDKIKPSLLSDKTGRGARWIKEGNTILWVASGSPASLSASGKAESYSFTAKTKVNGEDHRRAGFVLAWRTMRDSFYDGRLNGRDWEAIRKKYEDRAARAPDNEVFAEVIHLMLGELNGSHLGFYPSGKSWKSPHEWRDETAHLGLRFDDAWPGPGLRVRDVIPESPADRAKSRVASGEVILSIDGVDVSPETDLTAVLNGPLDRDILLVVKGDDAAENTAPGTRTVVLRPTTFSKARSLLRKKWLADNRGIVSGRSDGRLGYLHVPGMNWSSFLEFEKDIYAQGAGKEGLIIDVRDNGGGFTADYLLTVLCQPSHALTIQRGGGPGYPQDRRVFASWHKPIVVLCNQNSFSNAEIFSHAIKNLGRGKLVGVPTAGGVISTGARQIMDLGRMRIPFRGWFTINNGRDMELNGAVPHHIVWPEPGELPAGRDRQLEKAIDVLLGDVEDAEKDPKPIYRPI